MNQQIDELAQYKTRSVPVANNADRIVCYGMYVVRSTIGLLSDRYALLVQLHNRTAEMPRLEQPLSRDHIANGYSIRGNFGGSVLLCVVAAERYILLYYSICD